MPNSSDVLKCPECGQSGSCVTDCRGNEAGIRRRRQCSNGHRFTTQEIVLSEWQTQIEEAVDEVMLAAIKAVEHARDIYRNRNRG